jgi:hypothetical protein
MTLAAEQGKAEKDLFWLLEIELGHRIEGDTWTQDSAPNTACWWMDHAAEGEPSRVRVIKNSTHGLSPYSKQTSLANCQANASSWFYDSATGRLHLHTDAGATPGSGYLVCSHFWRRFIDSQHEAPDEFDVEGIPPDPRLDESSIPDVGLEIADFSEGGVRETWGEIKLLNADGGLDAALGLYIWQFCVFLLKCGAVGDAYADLEKAYRGRTGSFTWEEDAVTLDFEDQLRAED